MRRVLLAGLLVAVVAVPVAHAAESGRPGDPAAPAAAPDRSTEPVVLTGASFPTWAAPADITVEAPGTGGVQCLGGDDTSCTHNRYAEPTATTGDGVPRALGLGAPVDRLLGYRWNTHARRFTQIPFQVDEMAERYLANDTSGFAAYSETDPHLAYVWDQDRFRWTASAPDDPCRSVADTTTGPASTPDPVAGLDTNDELAFMASDAGPAAPDDAELPRGVIDAYRVAVADPRAPDATSYAYVMRSSGAPGAPAPAFDASNGYVRYEPDADSDTYLFSQSSYSDYGNAATGPWFDPATSTCHAEKSEWKRRRPKDTAWIRTPRYAFRYDGRWLMTQIHVGDGWTYGPDIVDQWKARAFQQRPGGETPCCGYEEEVGNWGGSSTLMGWRAGPVRAIRATWGADSGTNVVRTEVFYRDEVRMRTDLRVHPVPPGDGIYAQWDFNAGRITRYYNPYNPDGVAVDGKNDEAFGNQYVDLGPQFHNDVDVVDPTFSGASPALSWEEASGPAGTFVSSFTVRTVDLGAAHSVVTTPYYRDDSCFDDGTGTDPGVHLKVRAPDPPDPSRRCWTPADGIPTPGATEFWQGSIGTFGVHVLAVAESDNAFTTLPLTEIGSEQRIVLLPPGPGGAPANVGDRYGRAYAEPLVAVATPLNR